MANSHTLGADDDSDFVSALGSVFDWVFDSVEPDAGLGSVLFSTFGLAGASSTASSVTVFGFVPVGDSTASACLKWEKPYAARPTTVVTERTRISVLLARRVMRTSMFSVNLVRRQGSGVRCKKKQEEQLLNNGPLTTDN